MREIFIAGSRRFSNEIRGLVAELEKVSIKGLIPQQKNVDRRNEDTFINEREALLEAFRMINQADMLYVVAVGGYVGFTVALEIAYAYARNKPIVSSEELTEFSVRALVSYVQNPAQLVENLFKTNSS